MSDYTTAEMRNKIQAGDSVFHEPSTETWYVLGVNYERGDLCVGGYPPTIARIVDCKLIERGKGITDEEKSYRDGKFGGNWDE